MGRSPRGPRQISVPLSLLTVSTLVQVTILSQGPCQSLLAGLEVPLWPLHIHFALSTQKKLLKRINQIMSAPCRKCPKAALHSE